MVTAATGRPLGVLTADCVPVALWDQRAGCAGVAHAGRLGTVGGVAVAVLKKMAGRYGSNPSDVQAFIGPGIGPDAYEVGEDALEEVRSNVPDWRSFTTPLDGGKTLLDLWGMNRSALVRAGVPSDQVFTLDLCTKGNPKEFFSYRRDGPGVGRMMSVVWML